VKWSSGLPAGPPGVYLLTTKHFLFIQKLGGFPNFFNCHQIYISKTFLPSGLPARLGTMTHQKKVIFIYVLGNTI